MTDDQRKVSEAFEQLARQGGYDLEALGYRHWQIHDGRALCGAKLPNINIWLEEMPKHSFVASDVTCKKCQLRADKVAELRSKDLSALFSVHNERIKKAIEQVASE